MTMPAAVKAQQLKECRLDAAWEARHGMADRVICRECGQVRAVIDRKHLQTHGLASKQYRAKWVGAMMSNFNYQYFYPAALAQAQKKGWTISPETRTKEFAERYLTAKELVECRGDPEWEAHHDITKFVVCRLCGLKIMSNLFGHLRGQHSLTPGAYRAMFPKSQQAASDRISVQNKDAKERARKTRKNAKIGAAVLKSEDAAKVVWHLIWHREDGNPATREATKTHLSDRYMSKLRDLCGVPAPAGRPTRAQPREKESGRFHRQ
jgi:predicted transcriptional regulator